jgi:hypothetical protein
MRGMFHSGKDQQGERAQAIARNENALLPMG